MRPRLSAALMAGRAAAVLSRRLGRGGGTVIAGHLVPRIAPGALREVTRSLPNGSIVVSGTNGKTTTTRLISHILSSAGMRPIHNRAGANLLSGLFTAVAQGTDWQARPRGDVGLFEVDEATIPSALQHIQPRVLLLHNIFRDQLDRYGEVHFVAGLWREAIARLPSTSTVLLNADDPLVAGLPVPSTEETRGHSADDPRAVPALLPIEDVRYVSPSPAASGESPPRLPKDSAYAGADRAASRESPPRAKILTYGIADPAVGVPAQPHAADARLCPRCGAPLDYGVFFYGHLGHYACSRCGFARPNPSVSATSVELLGDAGSNMAVATPDGLVRARLQLPGLYNVYNALAAVAVCTALGVRRDMIVRGLETFTTAFGRLERIQVEGRQLFLTLVKNPVGFTEVLRTVLATPGRRTLLIAINDLFADGTDVSWLWDVEFERLADRVNVAVCSGSRAEDMAVRLKYAGVEPERIRVESDFRRAIELVLGAAEPAETVYVLPTYTAMLGMRDILRQTGYVRSFWDE
ncbi:MAG TPA: Mur ligase family protein [Chloroflexota bacterium]|nr:Mur ligase family protein [Chloroflexota bacterium]